MTPTTPETGWYWHVHHDTLIEWCTDYIGRSEYILHCKPFDEHALRMSLMQPVRGKLPVAVYKARAALDKALADRGKARSDWDKARAALDKALADRGKARSDWDKARADWDKAGAALHKTRSDWDKAKAALNKAEAALHKTRADWDKAGAALNKVQATLDKALASSGILRLHNKECPDCPWDGKTIFGVNNA